MVCKSWIIAGLHDMVLRMQIVHWLSLRLTLAYLFLHVHRGEHLVEVGGHTCIPATVTISAVLAGG